MTIEKITDKITLIHGDCMEYMRTLPDNAFALCVADPSYSQANGKVERTGGGWAEKYGSAIIEWDKTPSSDYFAELFRVSRNQIIWGGNYFGLPPTRCFLIWRKPFSEKFSMAMAEYAWTSFNANAKVFECTPQGTKNDPRFHPTQKPVKLYQWQYLNYANKGDRILDPNLGSGSSAIAAYDLGFEFVGIEIDKEYYEAAKDRLLKHIKQQEMHPKLDLEF